MVQVCTKLEYLKFQKLNNLELIYIYIIHIYIYSNVTLLKKLN